MKTVSIGKIRIYLAAALFLALTAVKLLMPAESARLCGAVRSAVEQDYDYTAAFRRLGSSLTDGTFVETLLPGIRGRETVPAVQETPAAAVYTPRTVAELRGEMTDALPDKAVHPTAPPAEAETQAETQAETEPAAAEPAAQEESAAEAAAVAAFFETQEAYADYAVPSNVSYEVPELPFAFASPVAGTTSSGFGFRVHPLLDEVRFHYGTDFAAWTGVSVTAFADGTVGMAGWDDGYGNYVVLDHGDGWTTLYAHCEKVYVTAGESVTRGQEIALVGATGEATGPHLHFELRRDGVYFNPEFYLV